jgi:hypothetical protein
VFGGLARHDEVRRVEPRAARRDAFGPAVSGPPTASARARPLPVAPHRVDPVQLPSVASAAAREQSLERISPRTALIGKRAPMD